MPTIRLLFLLLAAMLLAAKAVPSDQVDACLEVDYAMKECAPGLPARLTASAPPLFADRAPVRCVLRRPDVLRARRLSSRGATVRSNHSTPLHWPPTNPARACAACARCSDSDPRSRLSWQGSLQRSRHTGEEGSQAPGALMRVDTAI